jgi:hypothetical protein
MTVNTTFNIPSRRQFLLKILPVGSLLCPGGDDSLALSQSVSKTKDSPVKHKFLEESEMSFKHVFRFSFQNYHIPFNTVSYDFACFCN